MVVHENPRRSAVSEIVKPARLAPTTMPRSVTSVTFLLRPDAGLNFSRSSDLKKAKLKINWRNKTWRIKLTWRSHFMSLTTVRHQIKTTSGGAFRNWSLRLLYKLCVVVSICSLAVNQHSSSSSSLPVLSVTSSPLSPWQPSTRTEESDICCLSAAGFYVTARFYFFFILINWSINRSIKYK